MTEASCAFRAAGGEAEDFSGCPFFQLELLEHGRAQVLDQCARCIQGGWRRHQHRKQERQRQAAVLIQAGRSGALGYTALITRPAGGPRCSRWQRLQTPHNTRFL